MELVAQLREKQGKAVRALRREGYIPAELYGHGIVNQHLSLQAREFTKVFKEAGMNTLIMLSVGSEKLPVLVHDVQRDYLSSNVAHVDFYQVSLKEKIKARVPLEFVGDAPAVKEQGGVLNKAITELEVEALAEHLPHRLTVPLSKLTELNQSFYVGDLIIPDGVTVLVEPETVLITVTPPAVEEDVTPAPDMSTVKVEDEEKKEKRAHDKETAESS